MRVNESSLSRTSLMGLYFGKMKLGHRGRLRVPAELYSGPQVSFLIVIAVCDLSNNGGSPPPKVIDSAHQREHPDGKEELRSLHLRPSCKQGTALTQSYVERRPHARTTLVNRHTFPSPLELFTSLLLPAGVLRNIQSKIIQIRGELGSFLKILVVHYFP